MIEKTNKKEGYKMKMLMQEDLEQENYAQKLGEMDEQEVAVIRLCAKSGIREDVFCKIQDIGLGDKTMILYDFLTDVTYGAEWYDLLMQIVNEKEDSSAYLNIIHEAHCSIADARRAYESSQNDFEFAEEISREVESIQEETVEEEDDSEGRIDNLPNDYEYNEETDTYVLQEQKAPNMYNEIYHELVGGETVVGENVKSEHDMLIELAVKAGANYKDLLVKIKDMERISKIQNRMIEQQNEQIVTLKKENERVIQEKQFTSKEFEETKRKYESLVTKLTDISTFTGKNMLEG